MFDFSLFFHFFIKIAQKSLFWPQMTITIIEIYLKLN